MLYMSVAKKQHIDEIHIDEYKHRRNLADRPNWMGYNKNPSYYKMKT